MGVRRLNPVECLVQLLVSTLSVRARRGVRLCQTHYDQSTTTPSRAVIAVLAEVMGTDPTELSPLYDSVDPDALDTIVRVREPHDGDAEVTFTHTRATPSLFTVKEGGRRSLTTS